MDEVTLTGDEAVLASRIRTIDRNIAALDHQTQESVILGLHGSGAAMMTNLGQTAADKQRAALLAEREDLVTRMKQEVAEN
jgi:hypothetical protein